MENGKKSKRIIHTITAVIGLSLVIGIIHPALAYAAKIEKLEKTYETTDKHDSAKGKFPDTFEKNGKVFGIKEINTSVIDSREVDGESVFYDTEVFLDDPANHIPEQEVEKNDVTYILKEQELLNGKLPERTKHVESTTKYSLEYIDKLPEIGTVNVVDRDTGQTVKRKLPVVETTVIGKRWSEDFSFPIVISDYDAEVFLLGDHIQVSHDAELFQYRHEILESMNLPEDCYEVLAIDWDGEPYIEDGRLMRTATATGKKLIQDVAVKYAGDVKLEEIEGTYYHCRYIKKGTTEGIVYTVKATATYEREGLSGFWKWLFDLLKKHIIATISIILLLFILLNIIVTYILSKKEEKEQEEEIIDFSEEEEEKE